MALNGTTFAAMLKSYYLSNDRVQNLAYTNRPATALIRKDTSWGGEDDGFKIPVAYDDVQTRSASYAVITANRGQTSSVRFSLGRKRNYSSVQISRETMKAADKDKLAFMKARRSQIDSMINNMANDNEFSLFRDGSGVLGRVGSISGNTVTLSDARDVRFFSVNKKVQWLAGAASAYSVSETQGALLDSAIVSTVDAVDRSAGTVTFNQVPSTYPTNAANDYIVGYGDAYAFSDATSTANTYKKIRGFAAWLKNPADSDWGTAFNGVVRSVDKEKLGGIYYDAAAASVDTEVALINAGALANAAGGNPDVVFLHPLRVALLAQLMDGHGASRTDRTRMQSEKGKISFKSIVLNTGAGEVDVISAPACPYNEGYMLQLDTWVLASLDDMPHLVLDDGGAARADSTYDALNIEVAAYGDLGCTAPGYNVRIKFA